MAGDPELRAELESLVRVVDVLDELGAQDVPVAAGTLWRRIEAATFEDVQLADDGLRTGRRAIRRRMPRLDWARLAAPAAVAAAVAAFVLGGLLVATRADNRSLEAALEDPIAYAAERAVDDSSASLVQLTAPAAGEAISVDVVYRTDGTGYVIGDSLPALGPDRTYQLWAIVDDRVISAGVLGSDPGVAPFRVVGELAGLAITEEIPGGVVSSNNDPVAVWLAGA